MKWVMILWISTAIYGPMPEGQEPYHTEPVTVPGWSSEMTCKDALAEAISKNYTDRYIWAQFSRCEPEPQQFTLPIPR